MVAATMPKIPATSQGLARQLLHGNRWAPNNKATAAALASVVTEAIAPTDPAAELNVIAAPSTDARP
jgi:hypothetical protein